MTCSQPTNTESGVMIINFDSRYPASLLVIKVLLDGHLSLF